MRNAEFTGIILAATCGARLYPLTTAKDELEMEDDGYFVGDGSGESEPEKYMPKHLLPLAGKPIIFHLIQHCEGIGMEKIIIAISQDDDVTLKNLIEKLHCVEVKSVPVPSDGNAGKVKENEAETSEENETINNDQKDKTGGCTEKHNLKYRGLDICLISLPAECAGSADALRYIQNEGIIPDKSHVMVLPGDLVLYPKLCHEDGAEDISTDVLGSLADVHRREYRVGLKRGMPLALSMLLADVGEEDENGTPLKESAKVRFRLTAYISKVYLTFY